MNGKFFYGMEGKQSGLIDDLGSHQIILHRKYPDVPLTIIENMFMLERAKVMMKQLSKLGIFF